jgi:ribosomal protein L12E/L44/L45/RPP1/RPP2
LGASAKNSFTVWGKLTPRHNKFIEAILQSSAHIICCGRSKQEYVMNQVEKNGKTVNIPEKVGLKAITREGFDYEMTLSFDLAISHFAYSSKDRTSMFADKPEHIISQKTGEQIKEWNDGGKIDYDQMRKDIISELTRINRAPTSKEFVAAKGKDIEKMIKEATKLKLEEKNFDNILAKLKTIPAIEPEVSASSEEIPVVEGRAIETEEVETDKTEEEIDEELQEKMNRAKNKKEIKAKPVCQK